LNPDQTEQALCGVELSRALADSTGLRPSGADLCPACRQVRSDGPAKSAGRAPSRKKQKPVRRPLWEQPIEKQDQEELLDDLWQELTPESSKTWLQIRGAYQRAASFLPEPKVSPIRIVGGGLPGHGKRR
jgi:hypothetical protein